MTLKPARNHVDSESGCYTIPGIFAKRYGKPRFCRRDKAATAKESLEGRAS